MADTQQDQLLDCPFLYVDSIFEAFTGLEFRMLGCRNLDLFARSGISSFCGRALGDAEGPKSDQPDFIAVFKRV